MNDEIEHYLTPKQAGKALGRSTATMKDPRAWRRLNLHPRKIGRRWMFPASEISKKQLEALTFDSFDPKVSLALDAAVARREKHAR